MKAVAVPRAWPKAASGWGGGILCHPNQDAPEGTTLLIVTPRHHVNQDWGWRAADLVVSSIRWILSVSMLGSHLCFPETPRQRAQEGGGGRNLGVWPSSLTCGLSLSSQYQQVCGVLLTVHTWAPREQGLRVSTQHRGPGLHTTCAGGTLDVSAEWTSP